MTVGIRLQVKLNVTVFPQVTGMAATGNESLILAMATVMSDEARVLYNVAMKAGQLFTRGAGVFCTSMTFRQPLFLRQPFL